MKRMFLVIVVGYVLVAAGNRVAEHFGALACGCADDCWCHGPGLGLFRWVFPWGHRSAYSAKDRPEPAPAPSRRAEKPELLVAA